MSELTETPTLVALPPRQITVFDPGSGFDDFIVVPCVPSEIYARIRALEWRKSEFATEERLKIGAGTPPIMTKHGWLIVYHGVSEVTGAGGNGHHLCYSAGVMVLSQQHPRVVRYRSTEPVLRPEMPQERDGTVANVVFPTGIDRRDDLDTPDRFDVYYGMADNRIGVARLDLPEQMPAEAVADAPGAKV